MKARKLAASVTVLAAFAACGGGAGPAGFPERSMAAARGITLPDPPPARPAFLVAFDHPLAPTEVERAASVRGVALAVPIALQKRGVTGPGGSTTLRVGAVDPLLFRALAPRATRAAEFVWHALVAGEAVVTFDAAQELGVEGAGTLDFGGTSVPAGAVADNGVPNLADVLVADFVGEDAGLSRPRLLAVGIEEGRSAAAVRAAVRRAHPHARVRLLRGVGGGPIDPADPEVVGRSSGPIGTMTFEVLEGGYVRPDPNWVSANIVSATVPIVGAVTCHRLLVPQLHAALDEIERAGLAHEIYRYGGCYVPRFIDRDTSKPLSMHAFGLAVDLNTPTNQLGTEGDMDPRVIEIFEKWGFVWGGRWARPDPMHFELGRLLSR